MEDKIPEILADLPEDWGYEQIVAPEGESVGLTPQHGYNYLMRKVNECARALNQIVAEMGQIAPEDMVTAKGGGQLILPGILGDGPYIITLTEEETDVIATALQNKRAVLTDLSSAAPAYFDGTADIEPGVKGILPVRNGGTGVSSFELLRKALGIGSLNLSKLMAAREWSGTLTDGGTAYIEFTNLFDTGWTSVPFILFFARVTPDSSVGSLTIYDGGEKTISFSQNGNGGWDDYYLFTRVASRKYARLGFPYDENELWNGALGLKLTGTTGKYEIHAFYMNAGEQ